MKKVLLKSSGRHNGVIVNSGEILILEDDAADLLISEGKAKPLKEAEKAPKEAEEIPKEKSALMRKK